MTLIIDVEHTKLVTFVSDLVAVTKAHCAPANIEFSHSSLGKLYTLFDEYALDMIAEDDDDAGNMKLHFTEDVDE